MALTNKGCFKIGSTEFVAKSIKPSSTSITTKNSDRTLDGVMHIWWLRDNIRQWEISMPPCTATEAYNILSLVQGKTYSLTIWDVTTNQEVTLNVYTEDTSSSCYSGVILNGLYTGISFTATEF